MLRRCGLLLFSVVLAGCTEVIASNPTPSPAGASSRPSQVVVYPFAVDPADITLNQSFFQRAYQDLSGEHQGVQQTRIAHRTAENVCLGIINALQQKGWNATCLERGTPVAGNDVLVVDGEFTDISEGNRLHRLVIGFGAGASSLDTSVTVYSWTNTQYRKLLDFTTHAGSGKMPGAVVIGPAGAAAGAGTGTMVAANAAMGGAKISSSSLGVLADKTVKAVVDQLAGYFAKRGWVTNPSGGSSEAPASS
ncbi:MAG TPA: DUF4410 domain-containing protein [Candidatus Binataceae bacterium]|nr:DUF4410 domain-containing protein [Candidatus Binataceae bacterium]